MKIQYYIFSLLFIFCSGSAGLQSKNQRIEEDVQSSVKNVSHMDILESLYKNSLINSGDIVCYAQNRLKCRLEKRRRQFKNKELMVPYLTGSKNIQPKDLVKNFHFSSEAECPYFSKKPAAGVFFGDSQEIYIYKKKFPAQSVESLFYAINLLFAIEHEITHAEQCACALALNKKICDECFLSDLSSKLFQGNFNMKEKFERDADIQACSNLPNPKIIAYNLHTILIKHRFFGSKPLKGYLTLMQKVFETKNFLKNKIISKLQEEEVEKVENWTKGAKF